MTVGFVNSKSRKFLLKLRVPYLGKFAPMENNWFYIPLVCGIDNSHLNIATGTDPGAEEVASPLP